MDYHGFQFGMGVGAPTWLPFVGIGFVLFVLWSIFWKGLALWHSGKRQQGWWFIILLIVNTGGLLEIFYLFGVLKLKFFQLFSKDSQSV